MFDEDVLCCGEIIYQVEFLMDDFDFCELCVVWIVELQWFVFYVDFVCVGFVDFCKDFYQGGFVCFVFVYQCVNFFCVQVELCGFQGMYVGKLFFYVFYFDDCFYLVVFLSCIDGCEVRQ